MTYERPGAPARLKRLRTGFNAASRRRDRTVWLRRGAERVAAALALTVCAVSLLVMGEAGARHLGDGSTLTGVRAVIGLTSCAAIEAQGFATPIPEGRPGYWPWLDRDKDGWACEPMSEWKRG